MGRDLKKCAIMRKKGFFELIVDLINKILVYGAVSIFILLAVLICLAILLVWFLKE